jgi:hypothetical protein
MLQAWELTSDDRYLDEATAAARSMHAKGFEIAYQMNNVAFGMAALLQLHQITQDPEFLDTSTVLAAALLDNAALWECDYGNAATRATFYGIYPLPDAPYTAAYEEAEVAATCLAYLTRAGNDVRPSLGVLLPELIRHVTGKLAAYFPCNIEPGALAEQPKTGHIDASLRLPVEDLGDGWESAGTVGQEIYGAGMAFSTVMRSYVPMPEPQAYVYCDYPYTVIEQHDEHVALSVLGDRRLTCRMRIIPWSDSGDPVDCHVAGSNSGPLTPTHDQHFLEFAVPGGQRIDITFMTTAPNPAGRI